MIKYAAVLITLCIALHSSAEPPSLPITDTLVTYPELPTTEDSLVFTIIYNGDYCPVFHDDSVLIEDTAIFLTYNIEKKPCEECTCTGTISHTFTCGPQKAGTYPVYKVEKPYCSGDICPLLYVDQQQVGTVTISPPTSIHQKKFSISQSQPKIGISGSTVTLSLKKQSVVTLRAYSINGVLLGAIIDTRTMHSGSYTFDLGNRNLPQSHVVFALHIDGVLIVKTMPLRP